MAEEVSESDSILPLTGRSLQARSDVQIHSAALQGLRVGTWWVLLPLGKVMQQAARIVGLGLVSAGDSVP